MKGTETTKGSLAFVRFSRLSLLRRFGRFGEIATADGKISMKRRTKLIAVMDRIRREHYGDMPLTARELKELRSEIYDILGRGKGVQSKEIRDYFARIGWDGFDTAVLWRLWLLRKHARKIYGDDLEGYSFEGRMLGRELMEALRESALEASAALPAKAKTRREDVWQAVAKSVKQNKQKGMLRQEAFEKAIADNIKGVRALDLWRMNRGRPDEGEPGSSWNACYQTLYEKGYLKRM